VARAFSGSKSLKLGGGDAVDKLVYVAPAPAQFFEAELYLQDWATTTSRLKLEPGISELVFSAQKISAVHGDGAGGTAVTVLPGTYSPTQWHKIGIAMDYAARRWSVVVDGGALGRLQDLRFKNDATDNLLGIRFEGDQYADDVKTSSPPSMVKDWTRY
ncbi:MAG: hypothetical protein WCK47_14490, partial [bacterium]